MRFIHAADIHFAARNPEPALQSLAKIAEVAREREVDLIVIAGDLFDAPIRNSDADSMPKLLDACGALLDAAPVVSVQGTPSHDAPGCYEPIKRLYQPGSSNYEWFHIDLPLDDPLILVHDLKGPSHKVFRAPWGLGGRKPIAIVTGLPEPSRGWLSARGEAQGRAETGEAVVGALRSILAGIGAATHGRTVPHLHVQHGEVRGATLASGQVLPPGGIAVGTEDLALTGADYIALGHIHKAQAMGKVVYAGSAYPVNWGERDEKVFYVVEPGKHAPNWTPSVELVPYGHPARIKVEVCAQSATDAVHAADDVAEVDQRDVAGADVWLSMNVPADWNGSRDEAIKEDVTNRLMIAGAHGVRVTIERAPRERVRVPEIRNAVTWEDQVREWVKHTRTDGMTTDHLAIIGGLEFAARSDGAIPRPRRWRIKSLRLRGAIGIWRGSGRDEISIDFEAFDPGVIAITGPNGAGKTTILENMTPWPSMLTRGGPLQQHFRLRDSVRELVIVDDETGDEYRCLIQIDSQSGRREQRVYAFEPPDAWFPLGADGSTDEYTRIVDELWGPRPLHMLSVVSPQKPVSIRVKGDDGEAVTVTTDLATASRGMKRALLRQLLGLGAYQAASRSAGERAGEHEQADRESRQTAGHYDDAAEFVGEAQTNVNAIGEYVEGLVAELATAEQTLEKRRADLEAVAKAAAASREARAKAKAIDDGIKTAHQDEARLLHAIVEQDTSARGETGLPEAIAELEVDNRRFLELLAAKSDADKAWLSTSGEINDQIREHGLRLNEAEHKVLDFIDQRARLQRSLDAIERQPDTCSHCGQGLPAAALAKVASQRASLQSEMTGLRTGEELAIAMRKAEKAIIADMTGTIPERPMVPAELTILEASVGGRERALAKARTDLQRAQEWATKRQALEDERARLALRIAAAEQELIKAEWGINMATEAEERAQRIYVERAVQALADAGAAVKTAEAEARRAREDLERCQTAATKRTELLDVAKGHEQEADAHRLVSTALGADGVQSLLLEHAAPRIAEIATDLLEQSYGARWRVRIELQRTGGQGSKRKVIEDVRFIVRDSESSESFGDDLDPGEQLLETLSGGESVWIKAALSEAIGRVRQERMNVSWRTALRDEADAGLDEGAAASYWRLVEAAHAMSWRHHTVAITHSGAQHAFAQRIEMGGEA